MATSALIAAMQEVLPMRTKEEPSAVEMDPRVMVASRKAARGRPSSRMEASRKRERYEMGRRRLNVVATRSAFSFAIDDGPAIVSVDIAVHK